MIRFLHIADVHFDTTFLSRSERVRRALRAAIGTAFERAVTLAIQERVHGVLIAGDLFDGERLSFGTERFIIEQVFRLDEAGIPCFYATGNHDPGEANDRMSRMKLPKTFHYFGDATPRHVDIVENGTTVARVVGAGHETSAEERNLAAEFPDADPEIPTIGLLHALVTTAAGLDRHDRYAPCSIDDLRAKGYAYWALGHVHERQRVDDDARIQYPGNIQGRSPKETGPRGGLLVSIDLPGVETVFYEFGPIEWIDVPVDGLDDIGDAARLERRIRECYESVCGDRKGVADRMVRLILTGPTPLAVDLLRSEYLNDIANDVKSTLGTLDVSIMCRDTRLPIDLADYRNGQHLLSEVLALIDEIIEDDEILNELAPDPIADVNGSGPDRLAYLRGLLDAMDAEAATRLLVEER